MTPAGVRRRTLLRAAATTGLAGAGLAGVGTGCGRSGSELRVVVGWSGDELASFHKVVGKYERTAGGRRVDVVSAGDAIDPFLRAQEDTGNLPDVAVLSRPGLVREYVEKDWLVPMPSVVDRFPAAWNSLLTESGCVYGAWLKAAHKSLFWYLDGSVPNPPATWDELMRLTRDLAMAGGPAPLSIGAADGWVLTDWLENLLAAAEPPDRDDYDHLLGPTPNWRGEPVRDAFRRLGDLWGIPGAFPDGPGRALLTQFGESVIDVVARRRGVMVFEADFVTTVARDYLPAGESLKAFRFPAVTADRPLVVGGDAAVVFRGSEHGQHFVDWLTDGVKPFRDWIETGGYLSPNLSIGVGNYPTELAREFASDLQDPDERPHFDLSDRLPGALGGGPGIGMWQILQDFLAAVAGRQRDKVVDEAVKRLDATACRVSTGGTG